MDKIRFVKWLWFSEENLWELNPYFSSVRLSLLDRGFIFAIAHMRLHKELKKK